MTSYQSNNPADLSDAERAAKWAAEALTEGRFQLGRVLAGIAVQAEQIERGLPPVKPVSPPALRVVGQPPAAAQEPPKVYEQLAQLAADPNRDVMRETALLDAAGIRAAVNEASGQVHRPPTPRRCDARVVRDGITDVCGGGMSWDTDHHAWVHVDARLETDHQAVARV